MIISCAITDQLQTSDEVKNSAEMPPKIGGAHQTLLIGEEANSRGAGNLHLGGSRRSQGERQQKVQLIHVLKSITSFCFELVL